MTPETHDIITAALKTGESQRSIAKRVGVHQSTVTRVAKGAPRIDGRSTWRERRQHKPRVAAPKVEKPQLAEVRRRAKARDEKMAAHRYRVVRADGVLLATSPGREAAERLARLLGARLETRGAA